MNPVAASFAVIPYPAIDPIIVQFGPFAVRWYAVAYIAGLIFASWYMKRLVSNPRLWGSQKPSMTVPQVDDFFIWSVLGVVLLIILGNGLASLCLVLALRYPLNTALTVAAGLAQIGEFSIILAGLGLSLGLLPAQGMGLVLAGVLLSIALNSLLFRAVEPLRQWVLQRSALARRLEQRQDPYAELPQSTARQFLEGQVVLVGYGRVGSRIAGALQAAGIPFVVAEENRGVVEDLRQRGLAAVSGNAADPAVLIQAHIARAAMLVIATPDPLLVRPMADAARALNPGIEIVVRSHGEEASERMRQDGLGLVFFGEEELANSMSRHVLQRFQPALPAH